MNNAGRMCYSSNAEAVAGAIAQMEQVEVIGHAQSIENANLAHEARMMSALRAEQAGRDLMRRLGEQNRAKHVKRELTPEMVYPRRK